MGMNRETLKLHLQNGPLVAAIRQKMAIDETKRKIREALYTINSVGINEADEVIKAKLAEYVKASRAYADLIGDVWGLNWQRVDIVSKHLDHDLDQLPEYAND